MELTSRAKILALALVVDVIVCFQAQAREPGWTAKRQLERMSQFLGRLEMKQASAAARKRRKAERAEEKKRNNFQASMNHLIDLASGSVQQNSPLARKLAKDPVELIGWAPEGFYEKGFSNFTKNKTLRLGGSGVQLVESVMDPHDFRVHLASPLFGNAVITTYRMKPAVIREFSLNEARNKHVQDYLYNTIGGCKTSPHKIEKKINRWIKRNTPYKVRMSNFFNRWKATVGNALHRAKRICPGRSRKWAPEMVARHGGRK